MERLTVADEKLPDGRTRRLFIDGREVEKQAIKIYWRLKAYEDTGLTPEKIVAMKTELEAERYRHDRVQDFCTAEGELLSRAKRDLRDISACFTCTGAACGRGPATPAESGTRCGGYQWNGCAAGKPLP